MMSSLGIKWRHAQTGGQGYSAPAPLSVQDLYLEIERTVAFLVRFIGGQLACAPQIPASQEMMRAECPRTWMSPRCGMIGCQDVNGSAKPDEYNAIPSSTEKE
jgi:hypothetical protein